MASPPLPRSRKRQAGASKARSALCTRQRLSDALKCEHSSQIAPGADAVIPPGNPSAASADGSRRNLSSGMPSILRACGTLRCPRSPCPSPAMTCFSSIRSTRRLFALAVDASMSDRGPSDLQAGAADEFAVVEFDQQFLEIDGVAGVQVVEQNWRLLSSCPCSCIQSSKIQSSSRRAACLISRIMTIISAC